MHEKSPYRISAFPCKILIDFPDDPVKPLKVLALTLSDLFSCNENDLDRMTYWNRFVARSESSGVLPSYPWNIDEGDDTGVEDEKWMEVVECLPNFIYEYLLSSQQISPRGIK